MSNCLLHITPQLNSTLFMIAIWLLIICLLVTIYRLEAVKKLLLHVQRQQSLSASHELEIQEAERKRIAADLHDEIGGNLAALKMNLQSLYFADQDKATSLLQLVDETSHNVRRATHNLLPPHFDNTPLPTILREYFHTLDNNSSVLFHFYANNWQPHFDSRQELVLYRIIMELTNNIIRHARATAATVQLLYYSDYLELLVEDDGIGLPEQRQRKQGIGLRSIETRVQLLGGKIDLDTGAAGTTFIIHIPATVHYAQPH
jgi:two-component system, NarL family, sensor histidine kinase FusK